MAATRTVAAASADVAVDVLGGGFRMDQPGNAAYNRHIQNLTPVSSPVVPIDHQLLAALTNEQVQVGPYVYNHVQPVTSSANTAADSGETPVWLQQASPRHRAHSPDAEQRHLATGRKVGTGLPWGAGPGLQGQRQQKLQKQRQSQPRSWTHLIAAQQQQQQPGTVSLPSAASRSQANHIISPCFKYQVLTGAQLTAQKASVITSATGTIQACDAAPQHAVAAAAEADSLQPLTTHINHAVVCQMTAGDTQMVMSPKLDNAVAAQAVGAAAAACIAPAPAARIATAPVESAPAQNLAAAGTLATAPLTLPIEKGFAFPAMQGSSHAGCAGAGALPHAAATTNSNSGHAIHSANSHDRAAGQGDTPSMPHGGAVAVHAIANTVPGTYPVLEVPDAAAVGVQHIQPLQPGEGDACRHDSPSRPVAQQECDISSPRATSCSSSLACSTERAPLTQSNQQVPTWAAHIAGYHIHVAAMPPPPVHEVSMAAGVMRSRCASPVRSSVASVTSSCQNSVYSQCAHRRRQGPRQPAAHALPSPDYVRKTVALTSQEWKAGALQLGGHGAFMGSYGVLRVELLPGSVACLHLSSGAHVYVPLDQLQQPCMDGSSKKSRGTEQQGAFNMAASPDPAAALLALLHAVKACPAADNQALQAAKDGAHATVQRVAFAPSVPWVAVEQLRAKLAAEVLRQLQQQQQQPMPGMHPAKGQQAAPACTQHEQEQLHPNSSSSSDVGRNSNTASPNQSHNTTDVLGQRAATASLHPASSTSMVPSAASQAAEDGDYPLWVHYSKLHPDALRLDTALRQVLRPPHTGPMSAVFTAAHRPVPVSAGLAPGEVCERTRVRLHWGSAATGTQRSSLLRDAESAMEEQLMQQDADEQAVEQYMDQGLSESDAMAAVGVDNLKEEKATQHASSRARRACEQQQVEQSSSWLRGNQQSGHIHQERADSPTRSTDEQLTPLDHTASAASSTSEAHKDLTVMQFKLEGAVPQPVPVGSMHGVVPIPGGAASPEAAVQLYGSYGWSGASHVPYNSQESITFHQLANDRSVRDRLLQLELHGAMLHRDKLWDVEPASWAAQDRELQWRAERLEEIVQEEHVEQDAALQQQQLVAEEDEAQEHANQQQQRRQLQGQKLSNAEETADEADTTVMQHRPQTENGKAACGKQNDQNQGGTNCLDGEDQVVDAV